MAAGSHAIAGAIILATHPGSPSNGALLAFGRAGRVEAGTSSVVGFIEPVGAPFPDVARQVIESIAIGGKLAYGRAPEESIAHGVSFGKSSLPPVGGILTLGTKLVAPRIFLTALTSVRRIFPFGFGGQAFFCPF